MTAVNDTPQLRLVADTMLVAPDRAWYGWELADMCGLRPTTVYTVLRGLDRAGWVTSEWEDGATHERAHGRPRRRYYRFTPAGLGHARETLAAHPAAGAPP
jgi:hypothetical protein